MEASSLAVSCSPSPPLFSPLARLNCKKEKDKKANKTSIPRAFVGFPRRGNQERKAFATRMRRFVGYSLHLSMVAIVAGISMPDAGSQHR